jgi:hypothetical protein
MSFDPYNCPLKIRESIGIPTPKVGAHLGDDLKCFYYSCEEIILLLLIVAHIVWNTQSTRDLYLSSNTSNTLIPHALLENSKVWHSFELLY